MLSAGGRGNQSAGTRLSQSLLPMHACTRLLTLVRACRCGWIIQPAMSPYMAFNVFTPSVNPAPPDTERICLYSSYRRFGPFPTFDPQAPAYLACCHDNPTAHHPLPARTFLEDSYQGPHLLPMSPDGLTHHNSASTQGTTPRLGAEPAR